MFARVLRPAISRAAPLARSWRAPVAIRPFASQAATTDKTAFPPKTPDMVKEDHAAKKAMEEIKNEQVNEETLEDNEVPAAEMDEIEATPGSPAAIQYSIFNADPQFLISKRLIGPFGTIAKPTMVFSPKPYRIVGCVGPHGEPHTLGYFAIEGFLKHACPECGQVFQLTNNPDECCWDYLPQKSEAENMAHLLQ